MISRLETGHIDEVTFATLRAVAQALDARMEVDLCWKGGALDRLLDERHAALVGATVSMLAHRGWRTQVEVSYSHFGERGSIDVVGWHVESDTLLVVEVKTELVSVEATLRKLDEKVRLAPVVVPWPDTQSASVADQLPPRRPRSIGRLLLLPATTTSRRRVARHAPVLDTALPMRGEEIRGWLRRPTGAAAGIILIEMAPHIRGADARSGAASPHRVRSAAPRLAAGAEDPGGG